MGNTLSQEPFFYFSYNSLIYDDSMIKKIVRNLDEGIDALVERRS